MLQKLEILLNRIIFKSLVLMAKLIPNESLKLSLASTAAIFSSIFYVGQYSCEKLEKIFLKLARKYGAGPLECTPKTNSCLHVVSSLLSTGGHTRVLERWLMNANLSESHSIAILSYNDFAASLIQEKIQSSNGQVYDLTTQTDAIAKALQLRRISMKYEKIILHVHMFDYIPLLAYGHTEYVRPVIFYNHADHLFWLGISISDLVCDLRQAGKALSLNYRDAAKSIVIGIPADSHSKNNKLAQQVAKEKFGFDTEKKLVLSMASASKYNPVGSYNFQAMVANFLSQASHDVQFVVLGPQKSDKNWLEIQREFNQLVIMEAIPYSELPELLNAIDIYIDSYPMPGYTANIDAVYSGVTALSMRTPYGLLDYIDGTPSFCNDEAELINKTLHYLNNDIEREHLQKLLEQRIQKFYGTEAWLENMEKVYSSLEVKHKIHNFKARVRYSNQDKYVARILSEKFSKLFILKKILKSLGKEEKS